MPTTLTFLSLSGKCLNRIFAGAAQHQYKHFRGNGQVLLEMQQLRFDWRNLCETKSRLRGKISPGLPHLSVHAIPPVIAIPATSWRPMVATSAGAGTPALDMPADAAAKFIARNTAYVLRTGFSKVKSNGDLLDAVMGPALSGQLMWLSSDR